MTQLTKNLADALASLLSDVEGSVHYGMPFEDPDHGFHESVMAARSALATYNDPSTWVSAAEIKEAREEYQTYECEIDNPAMASRSDEGLWVNAWVWLGRDEEEQNA